jgi:hypothetical protein
VKSMMKTCGVCLVVVFASASIAAPQSCTASFTDCNGIATTVSATCAGCEPIVPNGRCYNNVTKRHIGQPNECVVSVAINCVDCGTQGLPGGEQP